MKVKTAVVFPGQGSQIVGMGKDFFENFKESKLVFEEASDTIHVNLKKLCFDGPLTDLTLTENLQPALFTTEIAMFAALEAHWDSSLIEIMAGHSLGEFSALFAAKTISAGDGVRLTRERGIAMQKAVPQGVGAMAAILGLDETQARALCIESSTSKEQVEPANFNAPGQVVISGNKNAVDRACALLKTSETYKGGKAIPLQVSAPFHCSLMKPAQESMDPLLTSTKFSDFKFKVVANVNAEIIPSKKEIPSLLSKQITGSVLWEQSMKKLRSFEIERIIEVGPGKVLAGLHKRIDKEMPVYNVSSVETLKGLK